MRRIHDTNLVFIHIPKTAGMAVTAAFGLQHKTRDHTKSSARDNELMGSEFIRFCVLRNPISRFISAYRYSVQMLNVNPNHAVRKDIIENGLQYDINAFIEFYREQPMRLLKSLHFEPQWNYVQTCRPAIILRQETLAEDIKLIANLCPDHYRGLAVVNSSSAPSDHGPEINRENTAFLQLLFREDYMIWGPKDRGLRASTGFLFERDADLLRDLAIRLRDQSAVSNAEALDLMRLAQRARPRGSRIREKIDEWERAPAS